MQSTRVRYKESIKEIVDEINQIYNIISNRYSFQAISQYCKGIRPNNLLHTLIKMVSSLQGGLLRYPLFELTNPKNPNNNEQLNEENSTPYFKPIEDFMATINFDLKIHHINLFLQRLESGLQIFLTVPPDTMNSSKNFKQKPGEFIEEANSIFHQLIQECQLLNAGHLTIETILLANEILNRFRDILLSLVHNSKQAQSPKKQKRKKKVTTTPIEIPKNLTIPTAQELLETFSNPALSVTQLHQIQDPRWTNNIQSYIENVEKNLHQLFYIFVLKAQFKELADHLHFFNDTFSNEEFASIENGSGMTSPLSKRKSVPSDPSQLPSPFQKKAINKSPIDQISKAYWAETAEISSPKLPKRKSNKNFSLKRSKDDFEEFADIAEPKTTYQHHMLPYQTILDLKLKNKKLEDLIKQCPHHPDEIKQLREENQALSNRVRELTQEMEELYRELEE